MACGEGDFCVWIVGASEITHEHNLVLASARLSLERLLVGSVSAAAASLLGGEPDSETGALLMSVRSGESRADMMDE